MALGGKLDYVTSTTSHNKLHGKFQIGPGKSYGPGLPNGLAGGTLSSKVSADRKITVDGGAKFLFGFKLGVTIGLKEY